MSVHSILMVQAQWVQECRRQKVMVQECRLQKVMVQECHLAQECMVQGYILETELGSRLDSSGLLDNNDISCRKRNVRY
jgi:hypothetical protein